MSKGYQHRMFTVVQKGGFLKTQDRWAETRRFNTLLGAKAFVREALAKKSETVNLHSIALFNKHDGELLLAYELQTVLAQVA